MAYQNSQPKRIIVISGYFNPLHGGHIDYMAAAKKIGDEVWVIVNNDRQQMLKKGKIIMNERERMKIVGAIKYIDKVILSIDSDLGQCETLEMIVKQNKGDHVVFAKGGDRTIDNIPEVATCRKYGIEMAFDVGEPKSNSSSRINRLLGKE
ncbi:MAG: adenylyltransferase/cytidyltransferase family protein [Candidatus Pacearchaeota archaeon]|nr:adenylyltransferase/cytidyltransferase family protein [Candidatus Pacearchaeota archaeon]